VAVFIGCRPYGNSLQAAGGTTEGGRTNLRLTGTASRAPSAHSDTVSSDNTNATRDTLVLLRWKF